MPSTYGRPTGTRPCINCGLPMGVDDEGAGSWSATRGKLTSIAHSNESWCLRALSAEVLTLRSQVAALEDKPS